VPYQQGDPSGAGDTAETPAPDGEQWRPTEGITLAPGTRRVQLGDIEFSPEGQEVRAALRVDTDQDGSEDILAITRLPDGSASLVFARRRGASLSGVQTLHRQTAPSACTVTRPHLQTLSPSIAVATLQWTCPSSSEDKPPEESIWMLRLGVHPRLGEQVSVHPGNDSGTAMRIEVQPAAPHDPGWDADLVNLLVTIRREGTTSRLPLQWRDHPSGFALDREGLQARLTEIAELALRAEGDAPLRTASLLMTSVCRGYSPKVSLGGVLGLPCRAQNAYRSLVVRQVRNALAADGWSTALELERRELAGAAPLSRAQAASLDLAWATARDRNITWTRPAGAPTLTARTSPSPSRITFLEEGELLVHVSPGLEPVRIPLAEGAQPVSEDVPVAAPIPPLATSFEAHLQSGLELQGVALGCSGYRVLIAPRGAPPATSFPGDPSRSPLVERDLPEKPERCSSDPLTLIQDDGGWHPLGWIPGAIFIARHDGALRLPVDEQGRSLGNPERVTGRLPAELVSARGGVRADGFAFGYPTPHGLLLYELDLTLPATIQRPPDTSGPMNISDVSFAPSGRRLSMVVDGVIWVGEATDAPPLTPPAPTSPNLMPSAPPGT